MSDRPIQTLAIAIQPVNTYDSWRVEARICRLVEGKLLNTQWAYASIDIGREYDGLFMHAYLGDLPYASSQSDRGLWGTGFYYDPHRIENADQATAIAKVMRKIEKGQRDLGEREGYLSDENFAGHVIRLSRILKISDLWVRNRPEVARRAGEDWKRVSGSSLQWWTSDVERLAKEGKRDELIAR